MAKNTTEHTPDDMIAALEAQGGAAPANTVGLTDETRAAWIEAMKPEVKEKLAKRQEERREIEERLGMEEQPTALSPQQSQRLEQNVEITRQVGAAVQAITAQQFTCAKVMGQIQTLKMIEDLGETGSTLLMKQMKESKQYKGMQVPQPDGSMLTITTFEEFCQHMGTSKNKVYEDIQNISILGESFMTRAQEIGLTTRQLRQLRALPEEDRQLVLEGESISADPEAVKDYLESVLEKKALEKKELQDKLKNAQADLQAKENVLGKKTADLTQALTELARIKNIPPEDYRVLRSEKEETALADLNRLGMELLGKFSAYLGQAVGILGSDPSRFAQEQVYQLTASMFTDIAVGTFDVGIDVDFAAIAQTASGDMEGFMDLSGFAGTRGSLENAATEADEADEADESNVLDLLDGAEQ